MLRIHCYHRCCGTSSSINGDVTIKDLWLNHLKLQDHEARKGYVSDIVTTNGIFDRIIVIFDGIQKLNDRPFLEKKTWLTKRNQNSHFTDQISASPTDMPFLNLWQFNIAIKKLLCFEWSPPWHLKTACWHHFCLKLLSRDFCPTNYPNHLFHLAGHCACQSVKQDINMSVGHVK